MKKLITKIQMKRLVALFIILLFFTSCNSLPPIKPSNIEGEWHHTVTKNMGGDQISLHTKLRILGYERNIVGFRYRVMEDTTGVIPPTERVYSTYSGWQEYPTNQYMGEMESIMQKTGLIKKWHFGVSYFLEKEYTENYTRNNYGERGAYIKVPDDRWNDYKPSEIIVYFAQGDSIIFTRSDSISF